MRGRRKPDVSNSSIGEIRDGVLQRVIPSSCFATGFPIEALSFLNQNLVLGYKRSDFVDNKKNDIRLDHGA